MYFFLSQILVCSKSLLREKHNRHYQKNLKKKKKKATKIGAILKVMGWPVFEIPDGITSCGLRMTDFEAIRQRWA